jgi:hypothetical protein
MFWNKNCAYILVNELKTKYVMEDFEKRQTKYTHLN